jgi:hypothetical protein
VTDENPKPLFISYKSEDRALAQDLYDRLTAAGFDVWFDVEALDRVGLWHELIEAAGEDARIIIPVLTPRWPRHLAVTHYRIAPLYHEDGNDAAAMERLLSCGEVLQGIRARNMHLDPPVAGLLEQLEGLGG